nr:hypothetical protein [Rickettsia endosymbiont of Ceutorhynchus assimilis]
MQKNSLVSSFLNDAVITLKNKISISFFYTKEIYRNL